MELGHRPVAIEHRAVDKRLEVVATRRWPHSAVHGIRFDEWGLTDLPGVLDLTVLALAGPARALPLHNCTARNSRA
jgi:hypothetical protein